MDRDHLYIEGNTPRLYELHPHNVDGSLQALSHILSMGVLAQAAAEHVGSEELTSKNKL
jgi:hypothetical protein